MRIRTINTDIIGNKYGQLTIVSFHSIKNRNAYFKCMCDCGNECIKYGSNIRNGKYLSCGCVGKENHRKAIITHGDSKKRLFAIYSSMKDRCNNKNNGQYHNYGGRGIKLCDQWVKYEYFRDWALQNGYKYNLTIDRINVNGNYEPINCRWADWETQSNNKRTSNYITHNG